MSERREYSAGEICRADLHTRDVAAAKSFYARIFGWRYEDLPATGGQGHAQAFLGSGPVAVIAGQNPEQGASRAPAQWNIYFAADDAQAIAEETPYAGGEVQFGPAAVAGTGVMAFLATPGGGTTGVWQAGTHPAAARSNGPGALAWAELLTPEPQAAVGFFQQLFGHEVTEYPQDDGGTYTTLMVNGTEVAGIAPLAADDDGADGSGTDGTGTDGSGTGRAGWQVYFGVANIADAVVAAVDAGAVVLVEPENGPGDDEEDSIIATLQDPQGAVFSLVQVQASA